MTIVMVNGAVQYVVSEDIARLASERSLAERDAAVAAREQYLKDQFQERNEAYRIAKLEQEAIAEKKEAQRLELIEKRKAERQATKWPDEKLHRSRVDWFSLVPEGVAISQRAYERSRTAAAMHKSGMTLNEIGVKFGVTQERVRQIIATGARRHKSAPVEVYFAKVEETDTLKKVEKAIRPVSPIRREKFVEVRKPTVRRDWMHL
jgi:DNA-directed RNA polymerase sigma subunit (sigma70/sigma32)